VQCLSVIVSSTDPCFPVSDLISGWLELDFVTEKRLYLSLFDCVVNFNEKKKRSSGLPVRPSKLVGTIMLPELSDVRLEFW
jgi:hypothetical protein